MRHITNWKINNNTRDNMSHIFLDLSDDTGFCISLPNEPVQYDHDFEMFFYLNQPDDLFNHCEYLNFVTEQVVTQLEEGKIETEGELMIDCIIETHMSLMGAI